jgi:hypothetical protein
MPETTTAAPKPLAAGPEAPSLTTAEAYLQHIRDALGRMLLALPAIARMQQTSEHPGHLPAGKAFDPAATAAMRTDFCDLLRIEHPIVAAPMGLRRLLAAAHD